LSMQGNIDDIINYWIEKSKESLESSRNEFRAGRLSFSVNRIYYSCFYIVCAILLKKGLKFKKHSGVRAAFHQHLVKPGLITREQGLLYDELFEARQRGDYIELINFEQTQVEDWIVRTEGFISEIKTLIIESQIPPAKPEA